MEAEQLRIGNIVNFTEGTSSLQGQVNYIGKSICLIGNWSIECINIHGIRLTEEWLVKLGFREMEDTVPKGYPTFWPPGFDRFRIYFSDYNQTFNCDMFDFKSGDLVEKIVTVDHVHQLQNLIFTITGKELVTSDHEL